MRCLVLLPCAVLCCLVLSYVVVLSCVVWYCFVLSRLAFSLLFSCLVLLSLLLSCNLSCLGVLSCFCLLVSLLAFVFAFVSEFEFALETTGLDRLVCHGSSLCNIQVIALDSSFCFVFLSCLMYCLFESTVVEAVVEAEELLTQP